MYHYTIHFTDSRPANLSTTLAALAADDNVDDDDNDEASADADPDNVACPPLFPPKHGYLECSRPLPDRSGDGTGTGTGDGNPTGIGTSATTTAGHAPNRPGSQCVLRCPTGYWEAGRFEKICDFNGRWIGEEGGSCMSECAHYWVSRTKRFQTGLTTD